MWKEVAAYFKREKLKDLITLECMFFFFGGNSGYEVITLISYDSILIES